MGLSVKWTFENESIFYAGEPLIIYLTLSCNSEIKKQAAAVPQPSFLSSVFGIFSPSSSTESSPAPDLFNKPTVEAENSRKKSILFVPKSRDISPGNYKLNDESQVLLEEEIQEMPLKIQLSNLNIAASQTVDSMQDLQTLPANDTHLLHCKTLKREKPPFARPLSVVSHVESSISKVSQASPVVQENVENVSNQQDIAWVFAQMQGNFKVDDTIVKSESFKSLQSKITYRIDGGNTGGGLVGGGALTASNTNLGSPSQPRPRKPLDSYPIYSTPPSIIVSDLTLKPGESRTFKYEILLPPVLPPSFNGRCSRISYRLILGVQKADMNLKSHIIKIPIRIFNRTNGKTFILNIDDGSRHIYEILNPIMMTVDESIIQTCDSDFQKAKKAEKLGRPERNKVSLLPSSGSESQLNIQKICLYSQRVSYDICKNNEHIAKLILLRGSYRLGDSVVGLINFEKSIVPTIEASVYLETVETVEPRFSLQSKSHINNFSLKLFSETHKFTLHTKRMSFVLALPLDGSPDFQTTAMGYNWHLRFEFITGLSDDLYATAKTGDEGNFVETHGKQNIQSSSFDCIIPINVYGVRKGLRKWKSQKYDILS